MPTPPPPSRASGAAADFETDADGDDVPVPCGFLEVSRRISKRLASKVDRPTAPQSPAFAGIFTCAGHLGGTERDELVHDTSSEIAASNSPLWKSFNCSNHSSNLLSKLL